MPSTTPLPTAPLLDVRHLAKRYGTHRTQQLVQRALEASVAA